MQEKFQQDKVQKLFWGAVWIFLFCYFMMLFDFPNRLTILAGSVICLLLLIKQRYFRLDIGTVLIATTIASYYIIVYGTRAFTMSLPYVGILMYVLGHYLSGEIREKEDKEKYYLGLLFALILGHCVHGLLNSYLFLDKQWFEGDNRVWADIWMEFYLPGTQQIVYFLPAIAFVFPAIIYFKQQKLLNGLLILLAAFFIYISMDSQTRTSVLILPLVFAAQCMLYAILEWKRIKNILTNKNFKYVIAAFVILLVAAIFLLKDHPIVVSFMGIMGRDGGILNNIRFKIQRHALEQIPLYPMGGDQMDFLGYPYAHNVWLDMANVAGWIPFGAFTVFTVISVYKLLRFLAKKDISSRRKLIVAGIYGAFFLYYTVERGFEGSLHFTTPWLFLNGLIQGELNEKRSFCFKQ